MLRCVPPALVLISHILVIFSPIRVPSIRSILLEASSLLCLKELTWFFISRLYHWINIFLPVVNLSTQSLSPVEGMYSNQTLILRPVTAVFSYGLKCRGGATVRPLRLCLTCAEQNIFIYYHYYLYNIMASKL